MESKELGGFFQDILSQTKSEFDIMPEHLLSIKKFAPLVVQPTEKGFKLGGKEYTVEGRGKSMKIKLGGKEVDKFDLMDSFEKEAVSHITTKIQPDTPNFRKQMKRIHETVDSDLSFLSDTASSQISKHLTDVAAKHHHKKIESFKNPELVKKLLTVKYGISDSTRKVRNIIKNLNVLKKAHKVLNANKLKKIAKSVNPLKKSPNMSKIKRFVKRKGKGMGM